MAPARRGDLDLDSGLGLGRPVRAELAKLPPGGRGPLLLLVQNNGKVQRKEARCVRESKPFVRACSGVCLLVRYSRRREEVPSAN